MVWLSDNLSLFYIYISIVRFGGFSVNICLVRTRLVQLFEIYMWTLITYGNYYSGSTLNQLLFLLFWDYGLMVASFWLVPPEMFHKLLSFLWLTIMYSAFVRFTTSIVMDSFVGKIDRLCS